MMETYAERLEREKKEKMTNYNFDEMKRQEKAKVERNLGSADYDGCLGQTDIPAVAPEWDARRSEEELQKRKEFAQDLIESEQLPKGSTNVELEISNSDLLHLAKAAHDRDITLNQLCIDVLKSAFDDLDYRFEHSSKPVVLKEY